MTSPRSSESHRHGFGVVATFSLTLALFLISPSIVRADTKDATNPSSAVAPATPITPMTLWQRWHHFLGGEFVRLQDLDLYGVSAQLPAGYLGLKWAKTTVRAADRYNDRRNLGPILPPLEFALGGKQQLNAGLDVDGTGGSHAFTARYGITDSIDAVIEMPFTFMTVALQPHLRATDDQGNRIGAEAARLLGVTDRRGYNEEDFLYDTFPALGRPTPATHFTGKWLAGDLNGGLMWNYHRQGDFSAAIAGRIYAPTGHTPPPERNLMYGTGPELEISSGSWALAILQAWDMRLLNSHGVQVVLSGQLTTGYRFEQHRPYPSNFVKPQGSVADLAPDTFPDLSQLSGTFRLVPGWATETSAQLGAGFLNLGVAARYGIAYNQKPELYGDPGFRQMVNAMELLASSESHFIQVTAAMHLLPLGIPLQLAIDWKKVITGRNSIVFTDYLGISIDGLVPLFPLWE